MSWLDDAWNGIKKAGSYVGDVLGLDATTSDDKVSNGQVGGEWDAMQGKVGGFANDYANRAASGAGQQGAAFARAQGLSPAQSAILASQQAGQGYSQGQNQGYQIGQGGYSALRGQDLGLAGTQYSADTQQNMASQNQLFGGLGAGLSGLSKVFSDERLKEDVKDGWGILDLVTKRVSPKTFKYKEGAGDQKVGIMAQDLEKTPLAYTVQDTPQGKVVDTPQLTTANTAMISELNKKLDRLTKFIGSGGKNA